jgi:hypothetical protein
MENVELKVQTSTSEPEILIPQKVTTDEYAIIPPICRNANRTRK